MKRVLLIFCLMLMPQIGWAQTPVEEATQAFLKANAAYRNGQFDAAIQGYEAILAQGFESGAVYYNLGNSYFKRGMIGKASLNYERARRLIPRDSDLQANLKFLATVKEWDVSHLSWLQKIYLAHDRFYTVSEMVFILTVLGIALGIWHLLCLYLRWPNVFLIRGLAAGAVLIVIYGLGYVEKLSTDQDAAIVIQDTQARFEPRDKATVYFELLAGQKVKALETEGDWQKIERSDKKMGWVPRALTERI